MVPHRRILNKFNTGTIMEKRYGINVAFLRKMSFNYLVKGARIVKSEADKITRLAGSKGIPLPVLNSLVALYL